MTSPISSAKKAIERKLKTLNPSLPTAYENVKFIPPTSTYLKLQYVTTKPDDPVFNNFYYREYLETQIFICDELNIGASKATLIAESIRSLFDKGTHLVEDGYSIHVLKTPQIAGSATTLDRFVIPVLISFVIEVEK